MTVLVDVWVPGVPRTKGSVAPQGRRVVEPVTSVRWQRLVAESVRRWREQRGLTSPCSAPVFVRCTFFVPLPTGNDAWSVAATWPRAGDVDKLARNALDALGTQAAEASKQAGAYLDDVQVQTLLVERFAAMPDSLGPGLRLYVAELADDMVSSSYAIAVTTTRELIAGRAR